RWARRALWRGPGSGTGQARKKRRFWPWCGTILNRSRLEYGAARGVPLQTTDQQGDFSMKKVLLIAAAGLLASCATYQDNAPSWLPGSGSVSVKLSGAEEVPPTSVQGSGSGT